jgi:DNA (cytosine-5)-methyltransferase 1
MKILNLYAGIGGNRKLWGDEHDITAVEYDESIAKVYKDNFPNDTVIVADAHQYLLDNYKEFDFIWSSNPCPSHSRARFWSSKPNKKVKPVYPDMSLYQTIIFLDNYFDGKWLVENVKPYYKPLITPTKEIGRHLFWANFRIGNFHPSDADIKNGNIEEWQKLHGLSIKGYKLNQRRDKVLRNCVHPETGSYVLDCALGVIRKQSEKQLEIF